MQYLSHVTILVNLVLNYKVDVYFHGDISKLILTFYLNESLDIPNIKYWDKKLSIHVLKFHRNNLQLSLYQHVWSHVGRYTSDAYILFYYICSKVSPDFDMMVRVFANGPGDLGSIPSRVKPKTQKMVLDASLIKYYMLRIKGKVEKSRESSSALPQHLGVVAIEKGTLQLPSTTVANLYL